MKKMTLTVLSVFALLVAQQLQGVKARTASPDSAQIKSLMRAIAKADLKEARKEMASASHLLNAHDGKFSPLGLAYSKLRENKHAARTPAEKRTITRNLNKIVNELEREGANLVYENYKEGKTPSTVSIA